MRALSEVECNAEVRMKLIGPIQTRVQTSFSSSNITQLVQKLQKDPIATNLEGEFDPLVINSILEGLKIHKAYSMRNTLLAGKDIPLGKLREMTKQVQNSCISFDSIVDIIN